MSYQDVVEKAINKRIEEWTKASKTADTFDSAIFSVMIGVMVDLKKDLGLD